MERQRFSLAAHFLRRRRAVPGGAPDAYWQISRELPGAPANRADPCPVRIGLLARIIHNLETQTAGCCRSDVGKIVSGTGGIKERMTTRAWTKAVKTCTDPSRTKHFLKLLAETSAGPALQRASAEQCRILAALFSGSQALSTWLVANPDSLQLLPPEHLQFPRRKQGLQYEVDSSLSPLLESRNYATAFTRIREFKQRQMLRIAARDLAHLAQLP